MGSNQSAAQDTFSVDPSGNISYGSSVEKTKKQYKGDYENEKQDHPPEVNLKPEPQIVSSIDTTSSVKSSSKKVAEIDLHETDEVLNRMKAKYKPNDTATKGSVFKVIEEKLTHCYSVNKDQPTKCLHLNEEYRNVVREQRNQLLRKSVNVPLITTVLVIITCIFLHTTTVTCYGAMSIDLGSEWMKVGLVAPSVPMDIVLNAQSQRKTPMAVAFSNGERFVGDSALDVASKYPERTFTHFLDLAGKNIDDESVRHYKQRFPYANITSHEPNSSSILLNHPEGLSFTPLELVAMMIEHACDQVASRLNSNEPSSDVVITIPVFFNAIERRVIEDAAKLVGLNVLKLINVNSAFALSYGIFRHKDYQPESSDNTTSILFFDQGASQTSLTLADFHLVELYDEATGISKNESVPTVNIRAQVYDRYLGGFDMQLRLRDHLLDIFSDATNIDKNRITKRGRSYSKLLKESGRVKKVLSANSDHLVRIENVIDDKDLKYEITREKFEVINEEFLNSRITNLLDKLYTMPNVKREDQFESLIIVGGNTRTPKIQQVLLNYFKLNALGKSINADEGAAMAALYMAASLSKGFRVKKFSLEEFGDEKKRFDPARVVELSSTTTTTTTESPAVSESTELPATTSTDSITSTADDSLIEGNIDDVNTKDPNAIYGQSELKRISRRLRDLREQDFLKLQRLSLRNSLESLLSEAREKFTEEENDENKKLVRETYDWLEDGPIGERDNITLLADKYSAIYNLVHPTPPTTPAPPTVLDTSNFLNQTRSILEALSNLTTGYQESPSTEKPVNETVQTETPETQIKEPSSQAKPHTEL